MSRTRLLSLYLVTGILLATCTGPLVGSVGAANSGNQDLASSRLYWQGQTLSATANSYAGTTWEVHETTDTDGGQSVGTTVDTIQFDASGHATVDSSSFDGFYVLVTNNDRVAEFSDGTLSTTVAQSDAEGVEDAAFEVASQDLTLTYDGWEITDGGDTIRQAFTLESNRGEYDVNLTSSSDVVPAGGSTKSISSQDSSITLDEIALSPATYSLAANVTDSTATATVTFDPSQPPSYQYEPAATYPEDTKELVDGTAYWNSTDVEYVGLSPSTTYEVRENDSGSIGAFQSEVTANSTGGLSLDLADLDGEHYLIDDSDTVVVAFSVRKQSLSGSPASLSVDRADSSQSTWTVSSNRDGYPLLLWSPDLTSTELNSAVPDAERNNGDIVIWNATSTQEITINANGLDTGTYQLFASRPEPGEDVAVNLSVTDSSDQGSADESVTKTPSPTQTPTPTPTTASPTATPHQTVTTETPVEETATPRETPTQQVTTTQQMTNSGRRNSQTTAAPSTGTTTTTTGDGFEIPLSIGAILMLVGLRGYRFRT